MQVFKRLISLSGSLTTLNTVLWNLQQAFNYMGLRDENSFRLDLGSGERSRYSDSLQAGRFR
jgi:hypothetical protein